MQIYYHKLKETPPYGLFSRAGRGTTASLPLFSVRTKRKKGSDGVALIVVLFAVALVSIIVLAYFNLALVNRNISFSSAGQARANILALSALDYVKGDFIAEIQSGSTQPPDPTGSSVPIYQPTANSTMLPYRMTASGSLTAGSFPPNLVKWSSGTAPLWPATAAYNSTQGPSRASIDSSSGTSIPTTQPSVNGRFIANSLWTKPEFGAATTFPAAALPQWVYMTRQGPLTNATPAVAISVLANSSSTNPNYVVGRYAYTVYDESGLLDVTAAGYSPTTFSGDPTDVGRKGNQGFADLTQLDPTQTLLTKTQIDQFITWRNASSWNSTTKYTGYLGTNYPSLTNAPSTGFLQAAPGDQAFVSRQDLINYWTTELGASASLLPYLTTFSREKNAPSWGPEHNANDPALPTYWSGTNVTIDPVNNPIAATTPLSYAYHDNQNSTNVASIPTQLVYNRFLPNVRAITSFSRLSGETAVVGEPLVKNRFDLNKLALITYAGVASTDTASQKAIYDYFGLVPNYSSTGAFLCWTYNHTSLLPPTPAGNGSLFTDAKQIMTLDQVANAVNASGVATGREPDFFELLQAVILQGSMGLASGDPTHANDNSSSGSGGEFYRVSEGVAASFPYEAPLARGDIDSSSTHLSLVYALEKYQVIQIGANIIDQYDTDNFPTDIILNGEHMYGVENLPYVNAIADAVMRPAPGTISSPPDATFNDPYQQYLQHWLTFSLWNPHQNATLPPSIGPTKLRIAVTSGEEYPNNNTLGGYNPPSTTPTSGIYMGRVFEPAITSGSVTPIVSHPDHLDGPAWIGINLSGYASHFSEPNPIDSDPTRSFTKDNDNPSTSNMNDTFGIMSSSRGWQRAGIYLGWSKSPDNPYKVPLCAGLPGYSNWATSQKGIPSLGNALPGLATVNPFIIELQYEDPTTPGPAHWHTYQVFRGAFPSRESGSGDAFMETNDPAWNSWTAKPPNNYVAGDPVLKYGYQNPLGNTVTGFLPAGAAGPLLANQEYWVNYLLDPRTARLNVQVIHSPATVGGLLTSNLGSSTQVNPGADAGNPPYGHFPKSTLGKSNKDSPNTWANNLGTDPSFYLDRDFNRRVGDAAGWAGASPFTSGAQAQRPIHLDRPFRSVAELGYVFRDDAWKSLNMISANSADSGLLDVFYIGARPDTTSKNLPPPDMIAGKMNINSAAQNSVSANSAASLPLQTLLSAGLRDYLLTDPTTINTSISVADATTLASSIVSYIKTNGPLINIGDLPSLFPQDTTVSTANPGLKGQREALIRALADSSDTRTWSLMIDVVAQSGKLTSTAMSLNNFTVEGEKHYWLHVAIDRFTGEIVDQQLEPVWE